MGQGNFGTFFGPKAVREVVPLAPRAEPETHLRGSQPRKGGGVSSDAKKKQAPPPKQMTDEEKRVAKLAAARDFGSLLGVSRPSFLPPVTSAAPPAAPAHIPGTAKGASAIRGGGPGGSGSAADRGKAGPSVKPGAAAAGSGLLRGRPAPGAASINGGTKSNMPPSKSGSLSKSLAGSKPVSASTDRRPDAGPARTKPPVAGVSGQHRKATVGRHQRGRGDSDGSEYSTDGEDEEEDRGSRAQSSKVSSMIRKMFGYNPAKYRDEDEGDDRMMEASFRSVMAEESRSARIAREEDEREEELLRLEEEERRRQKKRKKEGK
eukprot:jgi/Mesvir1/18637/Mv17144-RA.1